ncbi:hypothetical protein SDC9_133286 [bioreactor metagenome]|uniref:Uncharacterized protein n=1 Tax=bioreactor metagenome TaxID=1076179 RepID=A0A645DAU3_9ZZZZ
MRTVRSRALRIAGNRRRFIRLCVRLRIRLLAARTGSFSPTHAACIGAHAFYINPRSVHEACAVRRLPLAGGGNGSVKLPLHALGPQQAKAFEHCRGFGKFLIGTKRGGVLFNIGGNQRNGTVNHLFKLSAVKIIGNQFAEKLMIKL